MRRGGNPGLFRSCLPGLVAAVLLSNAGQAEELFAPHVFVRSDIIADPGPQRFSVCHGHTCREVATIGLDSASWKSIATLFAKTADTPAEERETIAAAIARFEQLVGPLTDTAFDAPENWFPKQGNSMDCIDESTNTTTYLRILAKAGFLRWHRVEVPATRGWFIFGWPHSTAVVRDRSTGLFWAVDSWFFDNGEPPVILLLEEWRSGWKPAPK